LGCCLCPTATKTKEKTRKKKKKKALAGGQHGGEGKAAGQFFMHEKFA